MKTVADVRVLRSLTARLSALTPEHGRRWGTLTAHEMLCHLGDSAEMVLRVRPRDTVIRHRQRSLIKLVALWSPMRWPHGYRTNPQMNPKVAGTRPTEFARDLGRAIAGLDRIAVVTPDESEPVHGVFGLMTVPDWQRWAYKHTDHHLRQFGL